MTKLLEKAFAEASRLPEGEQDSLAEWLLHELASEERWQQTLASSQGKLAELAAEALAEHRSAGTRPLDPDAL